VNFSMRAQDQPVWQRFRRNLSLSLLGSAFTVAIKLGQTALLVRVLRIDDFGRALIVLNLFVFLEMFVGLRVSDVIFRLFLPLKESQATRALQGLLLLCLCLSLATGLLVGGGVFILSPWLAERFYHSPELAPLFNIYGCTVLVSAFREVYEPVLRLHDRFASVIVPQVAGGLVTFAILAAYFASVDGYDLKVVVAAFTAGVFVQSVPPLALALRLMQPALAGLKVKPAAQALARHRRELLRSLFHSNLSGYLKFAINPGDVFLLGLFSTPAQVAVYGLARQLTAPLALLQSNVQTAVAPEVIALIARRQFVQLKRLIGRYVVSASVLGGLSAAGGMLLGHIFILARPAGLLRAAAHRFAHAGRLRVPPPLDWPGLDEMVQPRVVVERGHRVRVHRRRPVGCVEHGLRAIGRRARTQAALQRAGVDASERPGRELAGAGRGDGGRRPTVKATL
jgi:O-antigen/teichoic acid export membrane protein